jgi:hypothetical protein
LQARDAGTLTHEGVIVGALALAGRKAPAVRLRGDGRPQLAASFKRLTGGCIGSYCFFRRMAEWTAQRLMHAC